MATRELPTSGGKIRSWEVHGMRQLRERIRDIPNIIKLQIAEEALEPAAKELEEEVRRRAPKLPYTHRQHPHLGHLKDQIDVNGRPTKDGYIYFVHTGKAFWGRFLEFGTSTRRAYPFFRPAWDAKREKLYRIIYYQVQKGIRAYYAAHPPPRVPGVKGVQ